MATSLFGNQPQPRPVLRASAVGGGYSGGPTIYTSRGLAEQQRLGSDAGTQYFDPASVRRLFEREGGVAEAFLELASAYASTGTSKASLLGGYFYDLIQNDSNQSQSQASQRPDTPLWYEAQQNNPDPTTFSPVLVHGYPQLLDRAALHADALKAAQAQIESLRQDLAATKANAERIETLLEGVRRALCEACEALERRLELPYTRRLACAALLTSLSSRYGETLQARYCELEQALEMARDELEARIPILRDSEAMGDINRHLAVQERALLALSEACGLPN
ncbi:Nucleoporin complex subunit 54 [Giardia muris]|uniref:Nucleoporin complex subunit 54 n=1 Tax=Giardia muris TaxID=5742 RepID=A0A4Z1SMH2_GIAMU|nr:Nucleoporin complex subunit 54 [Giardia muris]|eukprot:TNJ26892.1 Nucleoporin complex subunit 54 [Giardia muris]